MKKPYLLLLIISIVMQISIPAAHAQTEFNDVDAKQYAWAMEAINFMTSQSIISGYTDGTFKPQKAVTKAEFTVMVYKLFDKYRPNTKHDNQLSKFVDIPEKHWAYQSITEIYDNSFTNEFTINKSNALLFEPEHHLT